jgi:hypothetical protein
VISAKQNSAWEVETFVRLIRYFLVLFRSDTHPTDRIDTALTLLTNLVATFFMPTLPSRCFAYTRIAAGGILLETTGNSIAHSCCCKPCSPAEFGQLFAYVATNQQGIGCSKTAPFILLTQTKFAMPIFQWTDFQRTQLPHGAKLHHQPNNFAAVPSPPLASLVRTFYCDALRTAGLWGYAAWAIALLNRTGIQSWLHDIKVEEISINACAWFLLYIIPLQIEERISASFKI